MSFDKKERFQEFVRRLESAGNVATAKEALSLLREMLTAVEDEMSGIPNDPARWQTDGRMYPPQDDNARDVENRPDLVRYRSRGHNTLIRDNGAIEIRDLQGNIFLSKPGSDGNGVDFE
ncbi:hypothetical protein CKO51_12315 [Rhodopirellula sp. SM50]|nr:hypothetical protein [Rhodopirellula sp. SM50]PAY19145.1 hypothetical protein CKO51_12315 [Rhodopirellula sp. SM50]